MAQADENCLLAEWQQTWKQLETWWQKGGKHQWTRCVQKDGKVGGDPIGSCQRLGWSCGRRVKRPGTDGQAEDGLCASPIGRGARDDVVKGEKDEGSAGGDAESGVEEIAELVECRRTCEQRQSRMRTTTGG